MPVAARKEDVMNETTEVKAESVPRTTREASRREEAPLTAEERYRLEMARSFAGSGF